MPEQNTPENNAWNEYRNEAIKNITYLKSLESNKEKRCNCCEEIHEGETHHQHGHLSTCNLSK